MHNPRTSRALSTSAAVALAITAFSAAPAFADGAASGGDSVLQGQCADLTVLTLPAGNPHVYIASTVNGDESEG